MVGLEARLLEQLSEEQFRQGAEKPFAANRSQQEEKIAQRSRDARQFLSHCQKGRVETRGFERVCKVLADPHVRQRVPCRGPYRDNLPHIGLIAKMNASSGRSFRIFSIFGTHNDCKDGRVGSQFFMPSPALAFDCKDGRVRRWGSECDKQAWNLPIERRPA